MKFENPNFWVIKEYDYIFRVFPIPSYTSEPSSACHDRIISQPTRLAIIKIAQSIAKTATKCKFFP